MSFTKTFGLGTIRENWFPTIRNYGNHSQNNKLNMTGTGNNQTYGAHTMALTIFDITLYYSYTTLIAFWYPDMGLRMRDNIWGPTTGRHMSEIRKEHGDYSWTSNRLTMSSEMLTTELYNLLHKRGLLPPECTSLPKSLLTLETDEIIDGKNDEGSVNTPGRKQDRIDAIAHEKEKKRRRKASIAQGVATRRLNRERAFEAAHREEYELAIKDSAYLQDEDLPGDGEEMIA